MILPTHASELQVPEDLKFYTDGDGLTEPYLLADSLEDQQRIMLFGRYVNLTKIFSTIISYMNVFVYVL